MQSMEKELNEKIRALEEEISSLRLELSRCIEDRSILEATNHAKTSEIVELSKRINTLSEMLESIASDFTSRLREMGDEHEAEALELRLLAADSEGRVLQYRNAAARSAKALEQEREVHRSAKVDLADCLNRLASARRLLKHTPITVGLDTTEVILAELLGSTAPSDCDMNNMAECLREHEWSDFLQLLALWIASRKKGA